MDSKFGPEREPQLSRANTNELLNSFLIRFDDATRPLTDAHAIADTAARLLCEHLRMERCAYGEVGDDRLTIKVTGGYTTGSPNVSGQFPIDRFGPEVLVAMQANRPFSVGDCETDSRLSSVREEYRSASIRSFCAVPLHKDGQLVAVMAANQTEPRVWLSSEIELVSIIANRSWESIERARVTRELRQLRQYFDAFLFDNSRSALRLRSSRVIYPCKPGTRVTA